MKGKDKGTRARILEMMYKDMLINGFQGLRADKVIRELGITKGALYHYFSGKQEIGYAVVDEIIAPLYTGYWQPVADYPGNPLDFIIKGLQFLQEEFQGERLRAGSPLSNLIQEMSPLDEGFRVRLENIITRIHSLVEKALKEGQQKKQVKQDVEAGELAWFILACLEGSYSVAKVSKDDRLFFMPLSVLITYLESLKLR